MKFNIYIHVRIFVNSLYFLPSVIYRKNIGSFFINVRWIFFELQMGYDKKYIQKEIESLRNSINNIMNSP